MREKDLLDLPPTSKLRIEDIPPHLRGFSVAQILSAPPFEPELESVWFWDLALLQTSDSHLKEYNRPTLALVYIHEGVPGHFVQQEYSNRFERIAPKVFWNGPMVEGWASYIATHWSRKASRSIRISRSGTSCSSSSTTSSSCAASSCDHRHPPAHETGPRSRPWT